MQTRAWRINKKKKKKEKLRTNVLDCYSLNTVNYRIINLNNNHYVLLSDDIRSFAKSLLNKFIRKTNNNFLVLQKYANETNIVGENTNIVSQIRQPLMQIDEKFRSPIT